VGLDVVLKSEVRNALRAAEYAVLQTLAETGEKDRTYVLGYEAGCRATLKTLALNFGLLKECTDAD